MEIKIKEKKPMPLFQKIFYIISFIFLIIAFIYLGTKNYNAPIKKLSDAESFTKEFGITNDNRFKYKNAKETLELLNTGTCVIFFSFPENEWSYTYAEMLNDVAKANNEEFIYYYNFKNDRSNKNYYYTNIVKILEAYVPTTDAGDKNIYAPSVVFVKDGTIVGYDDETSIMKGDISVSNYWTNEKRASKKETFNLMFKKLRS